VNQGGDRAKSGCDGPRLQRRYPHLIQLPLTAAMRLLPCWLTFSAGPGTDGSLALRMLAKLCELPKQGLANSPQFFNRLKLALTEPVGVVVPRPPPAAWRSFSSLRHDS
jgi:hypothetical protein